VLIHRRAFAIAKNHLGYFIYELMNNESIGRAWRNNEIIESKEIGEKEVKRRNLEFAAQLIKDNS